MLEVVEPVDESRTAIAFATEPIFASLSNLLGNYENLPSVSEDIRKFELDELEVTHTGSINSYDGIGRLIQERYGQDCAAANVSSFIHLIGSKRIAADRKRTPVLSQRRQNCSWKLGTRRHLRQCQRRLEDCRVREDHNQIIVHRNKRRKKPGNSFCSLLMITLNCHNLLISLALDSALFFHGMRARLLRPNTGITTTNFIHTASGIWTIRLLSISWIKSWTHPTTCSGSAAWPTRFSTKETLLSSLAPT